jgi:hypothetical protein
VEGDTGARGGKPRDVLIHAFVLCGAPGEPMVFAGAAREAAPMLWPPSPKKRGAGQGQA